MTAPGPPPVAVLMTLHRGDRCDLFEAALASVEEQSYAGEIRIHLCVDGPLPAAHEDWLAAHAGRFFRVERNRTNLGLARSLNRLIDGLGDEEYAFRMDGDDIALPERFARQAEMLASDPTLAVVGCQVTDIDDDGRPLGMRPFPVSPDAARRALARVVPVSHPAFCIRRDTLRDPALRYPDAHLCEDLGFLVLLAERGLAFANHPEVLLLWRTGSGFYDRRRDWRRGWAELRWYRRAQKAMGLGRTPAALYPFARLLLRLLPPGMMRAIYRSGLRERLIGAAPR